MNQNTPELKQTPRTDAKREELMPLDSLQAYCEMARHADDLETDLALAEAGAAAMRDFIDIVKGDYDHPWPDEDDSTRDYRIKVWLSAETLLATTAGESLLARLMAAEKERDEAKDDAVFWKLKYEAAELERDRLASTTEAKNYEALARQNQEVMALNRELLRNRP